MAALTIIGIIMGFIGFIMLIAGIVVFFIHRNTAKPSYLWILIGLGAALLIIGGIMLLIGLTRKKPISSVPN